MSEGLHWSYSQRPRQPQLQNLPSLVTPHESQNNAVRSSGSGCGGGSTSMSERKAEARPYDTHQNALEGTLPMAASKGNKIKDVEVDQKELR